MKKITDKLIAILLAMTLVISMSGVAFADAGDGAAANTAASAVVKADNAFSKAGKSVSLKTSVKSYPEYEELGMSTTSMDNSATTAKYFDYHMNAGDAWMIVPVTANFTGTVWIGANNYSSSMDSATIYLAESYALTENGGYVYIDGYNTPVFPQKKSGLAPGGVYNDTSSQFIPMQQGQTYYFIVMADNGGAVDIGLTAKLYRTGSDRTIPAYTNASKYLIASGNKQAGGGTSSIYFKIKPGKTGLLTVDLKEYGYTTSTGTVQLYNANKKAVSNAVNYTSGQAKTKAHFGVVKGNTYYVRVTNCIGSVTQNYKYGIRYKLTAYTDRALGSKGNALKLTRGGAGYKTLFKADNLQNTDWYKFNVTQKRVTEFSVNTTNMRSGELYITVYRGTKVIGKDTLTANGTGEKYQLTYGTTYGKANAGTYHVKIVKSNKASGQYTIKYIK